MNDQRDEASGYVPLAPRMRAEKHAGLIASGVGIAVMLAAAAISYGVSTGTANERMAAQDRRIEQVESRQAQTDLVVEKVRDALIKIGEDTAVTRSQVGEVKDQMRRMEGRIDAAAAGGRRAP